MNQKKVHILPLATGNIASVRRSLCLLGMEPIICENEDDLAKAKYLIIPGVGHFDVAIQHLKSKHWIDPLKKRILIDDLPTLGICLGMQVLGRKSEEGIETGLEIFDYESKRFSPNQGRPRLHVGWNTLQLVDSQLLNGISETSEFYFNHQFAVQEELSVTLAMTDYGVKFSSIVQANNCVGIQFHPEKSHDTGLQLISNFLSF